MSLCDVKLSGVGRGSWGGEGIYLVVVLLRTHQWQQNVREQIHLLGIEEGRMAGYIEAAVPAVVIHHNVSHCHIPTTTTTTTTTTTAAAATSRGVTAYLIVLATPFLLIKLLCSVNTVSLQIGMTPS